MILFSEEGRLFFIRLSFLEFGALTPYILAVNES